MKGIFSGLLVFLLLQTLFSNSPWAENSSPVTVVAEKLFGLEERYMKALRQKDYQTLYDLQHPLFKALVPFLRFEENEGRVLLDMANFDRISGLPGVYTYNPFLRYELVSFSVDAVNMDESGGYAKIETFVSKDLSLSLPVRAPMIISNKVYHYWEKVSGSWYILSKNMDIPAIHISGDMTKYDDRERRMLLPEEYAVYKKVFSRPSGK